MDEIINNIEQISGSSHKFQKLIFALSILIWTSQNLLLNLIPFLQSRPDIKLKYKDSGIIKSFTIDNEFCVIYNKKINKIWIQNDFDVLSISNYKDKGYSLSIYFDFYCNPTILAIMNLVCYSGAIFGYLIVIILSDYYGRKLTLNIGILGNILACLITLFSFRVEMLLVGLFLYNSSALINTLTSLLFLMEIVSISNRNMYNSLVNSGNFICILIYISIFYVFNSWKIGFIYNIVLTTISLIYVNSFVIESPKTYLRNKNFDKYIKCLIKVSEINNRKQAFEQFLANNNAKHYIENYNSLKFNTVESSDFIDEANMTVKNTTPNIHKKINCLSNNSPDAYLMPSDVPNNEINNISLLNNTISYNKNYTKSKLYKYKSLESSPLYSNKNEKNSLIDIQEIKRIIEMDNNIYINNNNKKLSLNRSFLDIFKYKSQLKLFSILSFSFFTIIGLYFSNTVSIKNLNWNLFYLGYIDCLVQSLAIYFSFLLVNTKTLGRKYTNILYSWLLVLCLFFNFFTIQNTLSLVINFASKFLLTGLSTSIYIFANELYPNSIKNISFGLNCVIGKISSVLFTFLIEIIDKSILNFVFFSFSVIMGMLLTILDETLDIPLKIEIPEIIEVKEKTLE